MRIAAIAIIALCMAAPALAEEVLFCTDTDVNVFLWDKQGKASRAFFKPTRFTVKVISETKRMIHWEGDPAALSYECKKEILFPRQYHCAFSTDGPKEISLERPIIFEKKGYTRSRMIKALDINMDTGSFIGIWIAHGTCSKF